MSDRWIVTGFAFVQHDTLARAITERDRLAAKVPRRTFTIMRVKNTLPASESRKVIDELRANIAMLRRMIEKAEAEIEALRGVLAEKVSA